MAAKSSFRILGSMTEMVLDNTRSSLSVSLPSNRRAHRLMSPLAYTSSTFSTHTPGAFSTVVT
nr:MAG TPA: hypothetical protein [Caudoviricetes sp.]